MKKILYSAIAFVLFLIVYFISMSSVGTSLDNLGISFAHNIDESLTEDLMEIVSHSGSLLLVGCTGLITLWFLFKREWKLLFFYYLANIGGIVFNYILKFAIARPRPEDIEHSFNLFGYKVISYSFPSGHTMRATILMLAIIYLAHVYLKSIQLRKVVIFLCVSYVAAMGISRVLLMDHFITDVLAAVFASISWIYIVILLTDWTEEKIPFLKRK